jgi:hypothetical protein
MRVGAAPQRAPPITPLSTGNRCREPAETRTAASLVLAEYTHCVAQSTGEKPGEESSTSRNLQVFGTIVGLVAFFLGVQNIGELKQKLFPSPAVASATPSPTWQPASRSGHDREAVKWRYVQNADVACAKTLTNVPGRIDIQRRSHEDLDRLQ